MAGKTPGSADPGGTAILGLDLTALAAAPFCAPSHALGFEPAFVSERAKGEPDRRIADPRDRPAHVPDLELAGASRSAPAPNPLLLSPGLRSSAGDDPAFEVLVGLGQDPDEVPGPGQIVWVPSCQPRWDCSSAT